LLLFPLTSMMYRDESLNPWGSSLSPSPLSPNVLKYQTQSAGQLWLMCHCDVR
jgi:hypothetical protein